MPNKTALAIAILILLLSSAIVPTPFNPVRTSKAWWNSSWDYYKVCNINTNSYSGFYQMQLNISYDSTLDGGENVSCESHCNTNFSDIRFIQIDNSTVLPYWVEEQVDGDYCLVWVNVSSQAMTDGKILMYYGNPSASSASNITDTFMAEIDGLVGSWHFEEETGTTVYDTSGNENDGTIHGNPQWVDGKRGKALDFDGVDDYVSIPDSASLRPTSVTLVFWLYPKEADPSSRWFVGKGCTDIYGNGDAVTYGVDCRDIDDDGNTSIFTCFEKNDNTNTEALYNISGVNQWYHIAATFNETTQDIKLYVNGVLRDTQNHGQALRYTGAWDFLIAAAHSGKGSEINRWENCIIDEVQVYNSELTSTTISHLYNGYGYTPTNYSGKTLVRSYTDPEPTWSSFEAERLIPIPTFSNILPSDGATGVIPTYSQGVNTSAYIYQPYGKTMNITFYWNDSGVWKSYTSWTNVGNGTYYLWNANFSSLNTTYGWAINTSNYGEPHNYTNQTFSFTTLDDTLPNWFIANEQSSSAITLEWNTSSQADSYYIRYDTSPHATWTPTTGTLLVNTTSTTHTHTGLTAGTTYYFALFIWNNTYGYSTEYREDHTNTYYSTPNIVFSNETPSDGSTHVDIVNNPPDPGGYVPLSIELNDTDGGGDMEYWLYVFDWSTHTWINRIHLTDQSNQTVTQDETTFNTTSTYYYFRVCTLEGGQYNNRTYKFLTDRKPVQPIAINPLNGSIITTELVDLKVAVYHPDYTYGWKGIDLDGANDDVRVSDDNSLNFTSSFSVDMALWIEDMPADGKTDTIISKMTDANTGWGIGLYGDDSTWELMICVDGHNQTVGTATLPIETWVYLTVVFDNTTHTMYVYRNGTLVYSYNEPNTPSANTADLVIGECSYVGNDKTFDGKIDYIRVYNVALTSDEVLADYYGKNDQCVKRGLVSWWKFDENTGTTASDSWGSNDGTLEDGTAWATGTPSTSTYNCRVYNVSFYTYPGNALIGYNHSSSGFDNGEVVTCNTTYLAPYCGNTYYWYAVAYDDEYNTSSSIFEFSSQYTDNQPSTVYYTLGADIYVNPQYTDNQPNTAYYTLGADIYVKPSYNDTEPNTVYYTIGAGIAIMHLPTFIHEFPTNGSTVGLGNTDIGVYAYKEGRLSKWTTTFYLKNSTSDYTVQDTQTTTLGQTVNVQTVNDSLSQGTFYNTTYENGLILNYTTNTSLGTLVYDYSTDPNMENPSKGRYIIHKNISVESNLTITINVSKVAQNIGKYGSTVYFGLSNSAYDKLCVFTVSDDTDANGISSNIGVNAYVNTSYISSSWTELTDTNWHELKIVINNNVAQFYVDNVSKGLISCNGDYLSANIDRFVLISGANSYDAYDIDEWDSTNQNMHFKHRRTDSGVYADFRWDDLTIPANVPVRTYSSFGYRESPEYSLSGMAKSTRINWTSTEPANTTLTVYYNLYNSTTWSGWQTATNNSAISGIADGDTVDNYKIKFKAELSTTNSSVTPTLNSLTFTVFRYTRLHVNVPINQVDTYQWYITTHNETTDVSNQTPIYTFDAYEYEEQEPSTVYYTIGADIYVNPQYTDNQPNTVYYTLGANISIIYPVQFSNPQPANSSTGQSINPNLKINVSKIDGDPIDFTLTFYSNNTVDETWDSIYSKTVTVSTTSQQIEVPYSGLQRDTQYWWKVIATNDTLHTSFSSSIYHFTTTPYLDQQPSTVYYTLGANISLGLPSVHTPYPSDNSVFGQQSFTNFSVYVADPNTPTLTVTFYKASTHTAWYSTSSPNNTRVYAPKPSLTNGTWFEWYVTVADTNNNITSDTWRYKPENQVPDVALHPEEGDTTIPVKRKLVTGMWAKFVKLTANVTDVEGDDLHITIYVDDPSQPNWNDWIMRLNLENTSSGIYTQDEELFNEPEHTYHWRLFVSDGYTSHNYYMNFTTDFYFWSYFTYSPSEPTQEDTVYLIDQSVNATDIAWYINGERVAYHNYSTGKHEPFNLTYTFNYSNIYNVSLWIHNDTCNNTDMWSENITVDWNVTLNTTEGGAGINYISCPLNINSSSLALQLLQPGEWIHHYNSTTESWESIWLYNSTTAVGDTFNITPTNGLAVVVGSDRKIRINLTEAVNTVLNTTVSTGYHYLGWTDRNSLYSYNISSIGLHNGDWLFYYNTSSGEWKSYRVNFTGDLFKILSHQCIIVNVGGERNLKIPWNQ